jgi:electron transfer flavoprotein beta subunit
MKIIVFIRQIVNPQVKLQGVDYFDTSRISEDDLIINPFDKNALEGALKLKDSESAEVTAICVGGIKPSKAVREAIAMGCNDALEVVDDNYYLEDPMILAKIYAKIVEKTGDVDLIFTGCEEQSSSSYAVPAMLAELLDIPIEKTDNGFRISHVLEGGRKIVEMPMRGLISCTDSQYFVPRYTSMRGILTSKRAQIPQWSNEDLKLDEAAVSENAASLTVSSFSNIVIEKDSYILKEEEPEEMVDKLLVKLKEDNIKLGV